MLGSFRWFDFGFLFEKGHHRRRGGNVGIAQRFPRAGGNEGNLGLVFLVFHGPAFPRRSPVFHAVLRSCRKPRNRLHLACCIRRADSVSLCWLAMRSKLWMLRDGRRYVCPSGKAWESRRKVSHGVA